MSYFLLFGMKAKRSKKFSYSDNSPCYIGCSRTKQIKIPWRFDNLLDTIFQFTWQQKLFRHRGKKKQSNTLCLIFCGDTRPAQAPNNKYDVQWIYVTAAAADCTAQKSLLCWSKLDKGRSWVYLASISVICTCIFPFYISLFTSKSLTWDHSWSKCNRNLVQDLFPF